MKNLKPFLFVALLSLPLAPSSFADIGRTHAKISRCLRHVVQDRVSYDENSSGEKKTIQDLADVLNAFSPSEGELEADATKLAAILKSCRNLAKVRVADPSASVKELNQKLQSELHHKSLQAFVTALTKRNEGHCTGVLVDANVSALFGVTVGTEGNYCRTLDGRRGFYWGLNIGANIGLGLSASAAYTDGDTATNEIELRRGVMAHMDNIEFEGVLGFGTGYEHYSDKPDAGFVDGAWAIGLAAGPSLGLAGGSVKILPLGTNWDKFLSQFFSR